MDVDIGDARERSDGGDRLLAHLVFHRTGGRGQLNREGNLPAVNHKILDEPQRHDVLAQVGVEDRPKRGQNRFSVERTCHASIL